MCDCDRNATTFHNITFQWISFYFRLFLDIFSLLPLVLSELEIHWVHLYIGQKVEKYLQYHLLHLLFGSATRKIFCTNSHKAFEFSCMPRDVYRQNSTKRDENRKKKLGTNHVTNGTNWYNENCSTKQNAKHKLIFEHCIIIWLRNLGSWKGVCGAHMPSIGGVDNRRLVLRVPSVLLLPNALALEVVFEFRFGFCHKWPKIVF